MIKVLKSTCRKLWCLSICKKSTSSLTYFMKYCKQIANLLFYEFGEWLFFAIKNHWISLKEIFMLIWYKKLSSSLTTFLRCFKEIANIFCLQAKNQVHPLRFPWDITEILQTCYFVHFGNGRLRTPKVIL